MNKRTHFFLLISVIIVFISLNVSCKRNKDEAELYKKQVNKDFEEVKELASNREDELFDVFDQEISEEECDYLKFLYAYMPLSDLADYDGEYFLSQVRLSLMAKDEFPWGDSIPEEIFRHFVIPYRVGNENPDASRKLMFDELKYRIEGMSMYDAALEVNHWCHEKVEYKSTSARTIAPLGIMKSAYGRCGEEAVFTVSALRSVGIPARQVYTPRWAHCDDNHAWVEVWANGKWYFLGACEPEAELNRGWFSKPVMRAMMVYTRVFGKYPDSETDLKQQNRYKSLNVLDTYIEPVDYQVNIKDVNGNPVDSVKLEFQLYNYAEFYPIAIKYTDEEGNAKVKTNKGTLLIHAYKDDLYSYDLLNWSDSESSAELTLVLNKEKGKEYSEELNIIVPVEKSAEKDTSGNANNSKRLAYEDSVRNAYVKSFPGGGDASILAGESGLDKDQILIHLEKSRGNYEEIFTYFRNITEENKDYAIRLLNQISDKDHRDGTAEVWLDHLNNAENIYGFDEDLFIDYVLNPRIANEKMRAYRSYLQNNLPKDVQEDIKNKPEKLVEFIKEKIRIENEMNHYRVPLTPVGVFDLKVSDKWSRNIFMVAAFRSLSIPARLEPATKIPQYYKSDEWVDVKFEDEKVKSISPKAKVLLKYPGDKVLKYRIHYSIAKFSDGRFNTLDYGWDTPSDEMPDTLEMETGYYMILTGKRLKNGDVLVKRDFFNLKEGDLLDKEVSLRSADKLLPILGDIAKKETELTKVQVLCWINADEEPGKHLLKEMKSLESELSELNVSWTCYTNENIEEICKDFDLDTRLFSSNTELIESVNLYKSKVPDFRPFCIVVDKDGKIRHIHSGYEVGLGEKLLDVAKALE